MAITSNPSRDKKKGKRPPTFQHLPRDRAAKLKKDWIEKAKVKKEWKIQKRRGDVVVAPMQRELPPHQTMVDAGSDEVAEKVDGGRDQPEDESHGLTASKELKSAPRNFGANGSKGKRRDSKGKGKVVRPSSESKDSKPRQDKPPRKSLEERLRMDSEKKDTEAAASAAIEESKPSLRELTRTAYSPASLHHVKSNQRNRHKQAQDTNYSRGRDQTSSGQRKGGQPNMALRMEAMLEKIKRDFA
ncbi:hypothetical protein SCHPADRAFT_940307 [Schizopora paradoxa]|uniref:rRNA-processing protein FYV7 n=1 Tax=Schizopora paradoxa TaxID=27342 RepID=A0A0H2RNH9_9AGAM|nr:hypothetical protein SCHPADRAFT_940307 [Schizopora paradoxa]